MLYLDLSLYIYLSFSLCTYVVYDGKGIFASRTTELPFRFARKIHQGSILCGTVFVYYRQYCHMLADVSIE